MSKMSLIIAGGRDFNNMDMLIEHLHILFAEHSNAHITELAKYLLLLKATLPNTSSNEGITLYTLQSESVTNYIKAEISHLFKTILTKGITPW